jgi:ferredoxin/flavodoxin---NADP+ reductase
VRGAYVTGWIKRGPRGIIGTNRGCAAQTVAQLFVDYDAGALRRAITIRLGLITNSPGATSPLTWQQWRIIDAE